MAGWHIRIRESLARKIALQLTQGLAYLHSEGIFHGNLNSSDVLFQLADFDAWFQEKVYEQLGTPTAVDLDDTCSRGPSSPRYLVDSAQFFRALPGLLTENIRIIDFGDSFRCECPNNLRTKRGNLMSGFNAPEVACGFLAEPCSDLWALGCIIYEIRAGRHIFPSAISVSPLEAMFEIMDLLGSLPFYLSSRRFDRHGNPDRNGETIMRNEPVTDRLSQVVA